LDELRCYSGDNSVNLGWLGRDGSRKGKGIMSNIKRLFSATPGNLLLGAVLSIILSFLFTFGIVNYAEGHEGSGFTHATENFIDIVGMDNNDSRCLLGTVWKFKNGRELCVLYTDHAVHIKELKGSD